MALDKAKKGTTHRGYHWVYHAPLSGLVLFDYREGRGREGPRIVSKISKDSFKPMAMRYMMTMTIVRALR